jgi:hypothetical protein
MQKIHFHKSENGKLVTLRKGIFNDPIKDGIKFVFAKSQMQPTQPELPIDDPVLRNMMNAKAAKAGNSNLVFGWANVTVNEDGSLPEDYQGDAIPTEVLEAAAYTFALTKGYCNEEHHWNTDCGYLIECMMFTKEKRMALGIPDDMVPDGLWVGFYIPDDEIYAKVQSGEYSMFSIEGYGRRIACDGEMYSEV